jgi:hypothetical protein
MKRAFGKTIIGAVLVCTAVAGGSSLADARNKLTPQQQLDKLLAGRVAGKPVSCISLLDSNQTQIIDKTAIVYGWGRTIYVNRPSNPGSLDDDDILITKIQGSSQLCQIDSVQLRDRTSHTYSGFVVLNDFVPYTRTGK